MSDAHDVEIQRLLRAAPERVFEAFSDAMHVARWLRPSPDIRLSVLAFDFRLGGSYRFAYDVPDGQRMVVGGSYRIIEPPTRLVFSWLIEPPDEHAGIESEVTVTCVPSGAGTELTIRHAKFGRADAAIRHDHGWRGALELLETDLRQTASGERG